MLARFFKNIVVDNYVLPKEFHFWYNIVSFSTSFTTVLN